MRLGYVEALRGKQPRRPRFNEAEAHAPRILGIFTNTMIEKLLASMRPRRMRLGYVSVKKCY